MHTVLNDIVNWCTSVITTFGLPGIFVLMFLESACIPIPAEATMMFAGFAVSEGKLGLAAVIIVGVAGNVVGAWVSYLIGLWGGRPFVDRYGRYVLLRHDHVELAERWFARYGPVTVAVCRLLPGIRGLVSIPAGVARMPLIRFTLYTAIGCAPFVAFLAWLGMKVGANWTAVEQQFRWLDYAVGAVVVAFIAWIVVRQLRRRAPQSES